MKHLQFALAFLLIGSVVSAQEKADSVNTQNNTVDVYYKMADGSKPTADRDNWDIALENKGFTSSVLINGQKGVQLYSSPHTVEEWANFDSTGYMTWKETINSTESWSSGAFNQDLSGDTDLGWGKYDFTTHSVNGDSIFLIVLADKSVKKIMIDQLAGSVYTFTYADVDGSNEKVVEMKKSDIGTQNFGFYSIENDQAVSREPNTADWDLLFTQYLTPIPTGPGQFINYPVAGVKINKGIEVAQRDGIDVMSDDTISLTWTTNITEIGSDWKSFNGTGYDYAEDRAYFVRLADESMWKIYFTKYEGGKYEFNKKLIAGNSSVTEVLLSHTAVYPNPSNGQDVVVAIDAALELTQINVLNSQMQLVNTTSSNVIETNTLTTGVYFLEVLTNHGKTVKRILVKN